ncbi:histidine phosphatase family protein [Variovorax sp. J22R133]|uniref:histidine phosphatase family protein n=1 Tax=Variovorax brevis TaxID=3053503 RepID=UPI00257618CE|nr:histidine phosphatase family protein [Variovorax sp. J22R133]MDM0112526.1 histidine phosphatase family protein [Variovorax sp. J22R133]
MLRHGKVDCASGLCYGASDVSVSAALTRAIAKRVAPDLPANVEVFASPLSRCSQLAVALEALRPDLQTQFDTRIAEMDFGAWEGRLWDEIGRDEFDAWIREFATGRAGGSGESTNSFMSRVGDAYDAWRAARRDALWVTHAGVIRAVWLLHGGMRALERADQWPRRQLGFGELVEIEAV